MLSAILTTLLSVLPALKVSSSTPTANAKLALPIVSSAEVLLSVPCVRTATLLAHLELVWLSANSLVSAALTTNLQLAPLAPTALA